MIWKNLHKNPDCQGSVQNRLFFLIAFKINLAAFSDEINPGIQKLLPRVIAVSTKPNAIVVTLTLCGSNLSLNPSTHKFIAALDAEYAPEF